MFRNKLVYALLLGSVITLSGCGLKEFFITDTGSGKQSSVLREDYLDVKALEESPVTDEKKYKIATLETGEYQEDAFKQTVNRDYFGSILSLDISGDGIKFGEYYVSTGDRVKKGDDIAYVYTEADEISVDEAKLSLKRLEEEYARAIRDNEEAIAELNDKIGITYVEVENAVMKVELKRLNDERAHLDYTYSGRIDSLKKDIAKKEKVGHIYKIKADRDGFIYLAGKTKSGTRMSYGDYIANLIDPSDIFITINKQAEEFVYGQDLSINTKVGPMAAKVVSGGVHGLYGNLDGGNVTFKLLDDGSDNYRSLTLSFYDSMAVVADLRRKHDVVLVPKEAVINENGAYYVNVYDEEDGTILKTRFIPGGKNNDYYWVIDGLSAGTKVAYN
jgi:multidrug efflux pump subunit AcrA (membrane-fusion protein)